MKGRSRRFVAGQQPGLGIANGQKPTAIGDRRFSDALSAPEDAFDDDY
jgi:hypothetical protein